MYMPPLTKINKVIIIAYVGISLLSLVLKASGLWPLHTVLGLSWSAVSSGAVWTLVTFPFVDNGLMTIIFNALILWFIGSELEMKWGAKFYLKFLAVATYSCGLIYVLLGLSGGSFVDFLQLYGLTGTNLALIVAYGMIYPERTMIFMFIFPMKAKYFCMLLAGIELFMAFTSSASVAAFGHVIAMLAGFLFLKYTSLKARGLGLQSVWDNHKSHQARKKRGNLRLVKEEDKANPEDPKFWQ